MASNDIGTRIFSGMNVAEGSIFPSGWREALRRIRSQLIVLALLIIVYILGTLDVQLTPEQLLNFLESYGAIAVVPISFLENLAGLNFQFPGSIAILTSMALTAGDPRRAFVVLLAIMLPAFVAHQINFMIGRRFGKTGSQRRFTSVAAAHVIFLGALWHPHFAALACIDAGAQGVPYRRFLLAFGPWFIAWNLFWGYVMYNFGSVVTRESQSSFVFVVFLLVWLVWDLFNLGLASRMLVSRIRGAAATMPNSRGE